MRYLLWIGVGVMALFPSQAFVHNAPKENNMADTVTQIMADYEQRLFEDYPELGLFWGKKDVPLDRFRDYSFAARLNWERQEDQFLDQLNKIEEQALHNTNLLVSYLLLKEALEDKKQSRLCREALWDVNPAGGWHVQLAQLADKQPVGSPRYRQLALKRWRKFGTVVQDQINLLQEGLKLGYTAPKPAVRRVLNQVHIMTDSNLEDSPFFNLAIRDEDQAFKKQILHLIRMTINPALKKYSHYLEFVYLPKARETIGVWALPQGQACYSAKMKQETTLNLKAQEVHELGKQLIQKVSQDIAEIGLKKYNTQDIKTIFSKAASDSKSFSSEEEILNYNVSALERAQSKVPLWFENAPKTQCIIKPYPRYRAQTGASGEYHPPNEEGNQPGIFYINTFNPKTRSRMDMEATLFHELIPGHHLQCALQHENVSIPHLNQYLWYSGYGEGWALYTERLADEMGLYQDELSRLGMLSNESLRAARLVVDTGIHALHWSREDAVRYLSEHTALDDPIIQGEVDRYIMLPGQALTYMIGKHEIEQLRQQAQQQLGEAFDIRQFHAHILDHGVASLSTLRTLVAQWIQKSMG